MPERWSRSCFPAVRGAAGHRTRLRPVRAAAILTCADFRALPRLACGRTRGVVAEDAAMLRIRADGAGLPGTDAAARAAEQVDLLLVLAADVSRSVDHPKFQLQREGYAAAITNPRVLKRSRRAPTGASRCAFVEWSGVGAQKLVIDWTIIDGPRRAQRFSDQLVEAPRSFADRTSISGGIDFSVASWSARRSNQRAGPSIYRATAPTIPAAGSTPRATRRSPRASPSTAL